MTLQTAASHKGFGAVLLQEGKPVYFASKANTRAQKGFAAIMKEALGTAWGLEKLHHFLYGRKLLIHTDLKPLEVILTRSLFESSPYLQ